MKAQKLLRQIHHWGSIIIALPLVVVIGAGLLLMLKKEISWIQPPTQRGQALQAAPDIPLSDLFSVVRAIPDVGMSDWSDLDRVDIKPDKGVIKFIGISRWEVQLDVSTAEVLQVSYRRSDLIESLHDGSFFADWTKLYLFFPAAIILFILWLTGLYLFFLPHVKKWQKAQAKRAKMARPASEGGST